MPVIADLGEVKICEGYFLLGPFCIYLDTSSMVQII